MTAPTDQLIDITKRSQDAFTTMTRMWVDYMQAIAGNVVGSDASGPSVSSLPSAQPYVDIFDIADKMLSGQREIAHVWMDAAARTSAAVTEQAVRATKSVAAHTANGAESAIDNSAEAARATGEQAASSARAARQAIKG